MLERLKEYVKLKRRSKRFVFGFIIIMLSIITGFSYAIFMVSTSKYRSSEMFIANLMYGINISDVDNTSTINGKEVTVSANTTETVNVTITSLNPIDSNYKLQYKVIEGEGSVYYSDKTSWMPYGFINKSEEGIYTKSIEIIIENTGSSNLTVEIGASGGYVYNSIESIGLISGYIGITEEKTTIVAITESEYIKDIVERDTTCNTTENGVCLYGGESKNNYLQYPESSNKSENIWRVIGTYNIDGEVLAKMISETSTTSTYTDAVSNLNSFYNSLEDSSNYLYSTNKFLCSGNNINCIASEKYTNIGLINIDEYNRVGGINSYLGSTSSYFSMTENNNLVSNITSNGIEEVEHSINSGLRGVVYVKNEVKVKGSGTSSDPYVFVGEGDGDFSILAWTLGGVPQSGAFPQKGDGYMAESVECTNGTVATWDNEIWGPSFQTINTPTSCTVHFEEGTKLYAQILLDNPNVSERTTFNSAFTASNNGNTIYRANGQDGANTYYFAGNVTNNYVSFGGYYWRIVRINEDDSVRLIYAGRGTGDTSAFISTSQDFYNWSSITCVGYMNTNSEQHGTGSNSSIKIVVDNWYADNLNSFDDYISKTAIYCNDRTTVDGRWATYYTSIYHSGYSRLVTGKSPTYICSNSNDRFTASASTGNGALTYPIGLITADEVAYAGGLWGTNNSSYYIAQNATSGASYWWTMSPYAYLEYANIFVVSGSYNIGLLSENDVFGDFGVRPVISLKSCVQYNSGDGTASNPYTVSLPSECATAEN